MKHSIIFFIVISAFACSCNNDSGKTSLDKESYKRNKEILQKEEEKNPKNFIAVSGYDKKNVLGQTVIKGAVTNKATVAVFKDIDLQLSFYSKTNTLLETDEEKVFEVIHPGETKEFKTKYFAPKGTDSVALAVLSAKIFSYKEK